MADTIDLATKNVITVDDEGMLYLDDEIVDEYTSYIDVVIIQKKLEAAEKAFSEIEIFCQRVEKGTIYSRTTYQKFLDILYLSGKRVQEDHE